MVIGLIGEKLAGKDEVGSYLINHHNAFYVKYSAILDEILTTLNQPISRDNEIRLGKGLREAFQKNVLWDGMTKRIKESDKDITVIGSIRLRDEFESAKALGAKTIYITAPEEMRYQRLAGRQEKTDDTTQTREEFSAQEKVWTEIEIPALGAECDFTIENTGTIEELHQKIDAIIVQLRP